MPDRSKTDRQNDFIEICSHCVTEYACCHDTRPPVTEERRSIIEEYLRKHGISVERAFAEEEYVFPRVRADGYCIFHDKKTRKCLVHPVKPETCVAGPITFDINSKSGKIEWFVKMERICPLAGVVYRDKKLLRQHLESAKREALRLLDGLNCDALRAVLKKDEPETFKIGEDAAGKDILSKLK